MRAAAQASTVRMHEILAQKSPNKPLTHRVVKAKKPPYTKHSKLALVTRAHFSPNPPMLPTLLNAIKEIYKLPPNQFNQIKDRLAQLPTIPEKMRLISAIRYTLSMGESYKKEVSDTRVVECHLTDVTVFLEAAGSEPPFGMNRYLSFLLSGFIINRGLGAVCQAGIYMVKHILKALESSHPAISARTYMHQVVITLQNHPDLFAKFKYPVHINPSNPFNVLLLAETVSDAATKPFGAHVLSAILTAMMCPLSTLEEDSPAVIAYHHLLKEDPVQLFSLMYDLLVKGELRGAKINNTTVDMISDRIIDRVCASPLPSTNSIPLENACAVSSIDFASINNGTVDSKDLRKIAGNDRFFLLTYCGYGHSYVQEAILMALSSS